ncbi:MAG: ABC transporter permease [Symbiobacteriia bacterium]
MEKSKRRFSSIPLPTFEGVLVPILAVVAALLVGALFIFSLHPEWSFVLRLQQVGDAYGALWRSTFGSTRSFLATLVEMIPLTFTGLAVALAFRSGLFNIGGEGQYLVGQMATAVVGYSVVGLSPWLHIPLVLLAGFAAGGLWAFLPGLLKARFGIHEVINTIMMNYIALYFVHWLLQNHLKDPTTLVPRTPVISSSAVLPLLVPNTRFHLGFLLALLAALAVYYLLWRTTSGYEIRAVGLSPQAAEYAGISVPRNLILAMVLSGALAGLAGAVQVSGVQTAYYDALGFVGYGFNGIAVALLGRNHPFGVVVGALLFGALSRGAVSMQAVANVPKSVIGVVQAAIIFFVAAEAIFRVLVPRVWRDRIPGPGGSQAPHTGTTNETPATEGGAGR